MAWIQRMDLLHSFIVSHLYSVKPPRSAIKYSLKLFQWYKNDKHMINHEVPPFVQSFFWEKRKDNNDEVQKVTCYL